MEKRVKQVTCHEKAEWYDALCEVLGLGFSLTGNSAEALIGTTNELIRIRREERMRDSLSNPDAVFNARNNY